jgi:DNA repair exonuclease SbcCD ATPase subunit
MEVFMFGFNHKMKMKIQEIEKRMTRNCEIIEEDHHNLAELKVAFLAAKAKIELLEQQIKLLSKPFPKLIFRPPSSAARIPLNDHEPTVYEGVDCACSPPGDPHSDNCKGWLGPR